MWRLLQILIVFAVVCSNIRWKWTENGYLASLLGVAAAFAVTVLLVKLIELASLIRVWIDAVKAAWRGRRHQRIEKRNLLRG